MYFNLHALPPSIFILVIIYVGVFVLIHNVRSKLNISFFFICITIALWNSYYIAFYFDPETILFSNITKISYCGINFIPFCMLYFLTQFLDIKYMRPLNIFNAVYGIIISILIINTPYIINGFISYPWGHYSKAGILHPAYLAYFLFSITLFLFILIKYIYANKNMPSLKLNQAKYVLAAFSLLFISVFDYMPNYGINIYPRGYFFGTIFILIIGYTIIKHKLMDIKIVIKRSILYSFLISAISLVYLLSVFIFEHIFHNFLGYKNLVSSMFTATLIALIFIPLKNKLQYLVDKILFKGTTLEIVEQNECLRQEIIQSEKLKSVAIFASGMAHEIKNPLTPLKTFSEYLPKKMDDKEFLRKFAPIIAYEVNRIDTLVHELLDFAKPAPLHIKPTNIHALLDGTIEFLSNDLIKHNIRVIKHYRLPSDILLGLDNNQFKQALLNILLNAVEAMSGGGELTLLTSPASSPENILIKIQDTGAGIATEDISHIFDPFFTKKDQGTGLGLSITHEIIKNHQGRIFVESTAGSGTTFIIELPYSSPL